MDWMPGERLSMNHFFLIENGRTVNVAYTPEQAVLLTKLGWQIVADLSDLEWAEVLKRGHEYARQNGKQCTLPRLLSDEEQAAMLCQAYRMIFGDELWQSLGTMYQKDPEAAMEIGMEVLEI